MRKFTWKTAEIFFRLNQSNCIDWNRWLGRQAMSDPCWAWKEVSFNEEKPFESKGSNWFDSIQLIRFFNSIHFSNKIHLLITCVVWFKFGGWEDLTKRVPVNWLLSLAIWNTVRNKNVIQTLNPLATISFKWYSYLPYHSRTLTHSVSVRFNSFSFASVLPLPFTWLKIIAYTHSLINFVFFLSKWWLVFA